MAKLLQKSMFGWTVALLAVLPQGGVATDESLIPTHEVGRWRSEPSYLDKFSFATPTHPTKRLNSCEDPDAFQVCSGRGHCALWFDNLDGEQPPHQRSFCKCDRGWADPECRTERKSQLTAFLLSMFLGVFGADQFYLGFWRYGIVKCVTLGGAGFWWIYDVVRIGSSAVDTHGSFRVAQDVHHWAFVLCVISISMVIGFAVSTWGVLHQGEKRRALEGEARRLQKEIFPHYDVPTTKSPFRQIADEEASQGSFHLPASRAVPSSVSSGVAITSRAGHAAGANSPAAAASPLAQPLSMQSASGTAPHSAPLSPAQLAVNSMSPGTILMQ